MNTDWIITFASLVGLTFVVSVSPVSRMVATWLQGFNRPYNPLLWLGHGMTCTLQTGFWIGFWWGVVDGMNPIASGGLLAGGAFVTDLSLALFDSSIRGMMMRYAPPQSQEQSAAQQILRRFQPPEPKIIEKEVQRGPRALTEDEAHGSMDAEEERFEKGPVR